jgi:hypothetical protein
MTLAASTTVIGAGGGGRLSVSSGMTVVQTCP